MKIKNEKDRNLFKLDNFTWIDPAQSEELKIGLELQNNLRNNA